MGARPTRALTAPDPTLTHLEPTADRRWWRVHGRDIDRSDRHDGHVSARRRSRSSPAATRRTCRSSLAPDILSSRSRRRRSRSSRTSTLHETKNGSNRIRLGVDPWADPTGDYPGKFVGDPTRNQAYLYVVARDGSLRIIDVFNPGQETECETNFDPLDPQKDQSMPVDVTPGNACIPYGKVNRRPYSANSTAGLRFPTVPVDVAAANLSGDNGEDTVNGGYAWVLTASGTIYLVNINPKLRSIKAVVAQQPGAAVPVAARTSDEPFVYKNGVPDSSNLVSEATPYPNQPRDRNVHQLHGVARSVAGAQRGSTCRRCS